MLLKPQSCTQEGLGCLRDGLCLTEKVVLDSLCNISHGGLIWSWRLCRTNHVDMKSLGWPSANKTRNHIKVELGHKEKTVK